MNAPDALTPVPTLDDIETACQALDASREELRTLVARMGAEIAETTRHYRPDMKRLIDVIATRHARLLALVEAGAPLFRKPRSVQFHGIKCGWQKGKGGITWDDDERVCGLIRKHFPDQTDALIKSTHKPVAAALAQLDVRDLKRVGCSVTDAGDAAFVKVADTELDKTVKRLIDDATATD